MTGERRLNYGTDQTDARWSQRHDTSNERFIIAEDTDGATVLLEYDESASEFVYRGPVNMNNNDITNVGALDATSVGTDSLTVNLASVATADLSGTYSGVSAGTFQKLVDNELSDKNNEMSASAVFTPDQSGTYNVLAFANVFGANVGDRYEIRLRDTSASTTVDSVDQRERTSSGTFLQVDLIGDLTAGNNYEVQITNLDNSWSAAGGDIDLRRLVVEQ